VEKLVARHGVPSWVIPNALQRTFFDFPRTAASSAVPVLINVGVISGLKRQRKILEIWRELRAEGFDFEAIFVGASDSQNAYAVQFQAELKAAQAAGAPFSYLPRLEVEGLCQLFDTASAMVHFSEEETFGLVFGEALTRNLPLFASDVGSVRDIAAGVSGVEIFAPQDFPGLKNALRAWLQRGAGAGPRPSEAPIPITERYHPDVVARRHLEVYREVLAKRASGAL
jgi:glycosyltransferase involved in cell wall biosynthesis